MKSIKIKNAAIHNLKNVSVEIPLNKLVVVVGPSGSGKTSLIYDVLYKTAIGEATGHNISQLPKTQAIGQKVKVPIGRNLSLGEYNRSRLDKTIKLLQKGDLLIVDEACAGLNPAECERVLQQLKQLVTEGMSVIAIDHAKELIKGADYIIEFGPKSGKYGGEITFQGDLKEFQKSTGITAAHVFSTKAEQVDYQRKPSAKARAMQKKHVSLANINKHNLKNFRFRFPLGSLVSVFGKAGSGKTTILNIVYANFFKGKNAWKIRDQGEQKLHIEGKQHIRRTYLVDQTPIGNHPTSRPVTYLNVWDGIREIFADQPTARRKKLGKASFLVPKDILEGGQSLSEDILAVTYRGKHLADVLGMTIDEAIELFHDLPVVKRKLGFLQEVGLGYLTLGQRSATLSGGEAQRVKLAKILSKKLGDRCVYILDTPSKGLHLSDLPVLVKVLQKIIDNNNTILIAENRVELLNNSDWTLDMDKRQ